VSGGASVIGARVAVSTLGSWLGVDPNSITRVAVRTSRVCSVAGAKVRMKAAGTCVVRLYQGRKAQAVSVRVTPTLAS